MPNKEETMNEFKDANGNTHIMNGGNPLEGCPKSWDEAREWEKKSNEEKYGDGFAEPIWSFDCGFKLDFDGSLIHISSRFYPPKNHYGPKWDGWVSLNIGDCCDENKLFEREFVCDSLDELKEQVEKYVSEIQNKLVKLIKDNFQEQIKEKRQKC